jgi:hypothetical protein
MVRDVRLGLRLESLDVGTGGERRILSSRSGGILKHDGGIFWNGTVRLFVLPQDAFAG